MTKKKKFALKVFSLSALSVITLAAPSASRANLNASALSGKGNYSADFKSLSEAQKAAKQLSQSIAEEGITLLKNKGNSALPAKGDERVSVFGVYADDMIGTSQKLTEVMEEEGFSVNQSLADFYASKNGSSSSGSQMGGNQTKAKTELTDTDFTQQVKGSINLYNDMGVVVISRDGGEGSDVEPVTNEVEDNKYGTKDQGWTHKDLLKDAQGQEKKHTLQLTDKEEALLEYVKQKCNKVVVVVNTSNVIEMSNLQNDEGIDGILWIGRLGDAGLSAVPKILNGSVNPSGRTTDIWAKDFTADSTWINYGTGRQVDDVPLVNGVQYYVEQDSSGDKNRFYYPGTDEEGNPTYSEYVRDSHGNEYRSGPDMFEGYSFTYYEEGIYAGYRYYETADAEAKAGNYAGFDYNDAVVYPFGYGLSYTEFEWENVTPAANVANWSAKDQIELKVKVTNTGSVAGKEVVQVYAHAPYIAGEVEKSENVLAGFAKTGELAPGKSEILTITVDVQDIASFDDYDKNNNGHATYELDAGSGYELRFQTDSHNIKAVQELSDLAQDVFKDVDMYSGNEIKALLSTDGDEYNSLGYDPKTNKNLKQEGKYVELSRANFAGTFPDTHTMEEMSRSQEWFKWMMGRDLYTADETISLSNKYAENIATVADFGYDEDESDDAVGQQPWVVKASEFANGGKYANWTQKANSTDERQYKYSDMAGIDLYSNEVITDTTSPFYGKTGAQAWELFMNELTYQEMVIVVSNITEKQIDTIGTPRTPANDSPKNLGSSFDWGDECHIAATFNTKLAEQEGIIVGNISLFQNSGWYGPAMDGHRSPFGGRNNEYYSEDGYLAGMIGANVVSGAQSKGCACYIKHFALNEQETGRVHSSAIITEQAARELYFKQFKISIQKGNAQWIMCSMGSVGDIQFGVNYNIMTEMLRDEWGYTGMVATDAWNPQKDCWPIDLMVRSGLDAALQDADKTGAGSSAKATYLVSGSWNAEKNTVEINSYKRDDAGEFVLDDAGNKVVVKKDSYTQWKSVRECAQRILFTNVNSNYIKNGYDLTSYSGQATLAAATQGINYNASVKADFEAETIKYELASGNLPEGLTLDSNGNISGTATKAGNYTVSVKVTLENYVTATKTFNIAVGSAFELDTDISNVNVGDEIDAYIESDTIKLSQADGDGGYTTITYAVSDGALPAGVAISGDRVVGTPTTPGTYNATIHIVAQKVSESTDKKGNVSQSIKTEEFDYELTINVAGEAVAPEYELNVPYIGENGNWFVNGVDTQVKAAGTDGQDGQPGTNGTNGTDGKDGKDGQDGKDGKDGADGVSSSAGCGGSATAATGLGLFGLLGALLLSKKRKQK